MQPLNKKSSTTLGVAALVALFVWGVISCWHPILGIIWVIISILGLGISFWESPKGS